MEIKLQCGDTITIPEGCKATIKDGSVVFEKEEQEFKDGDILVTATRESRDNAFIYKGTDENGFHSYYVGIDSIKQLSISTSPSNRWSNSNLSYATEEEKQLLFNKMKEQGLKWNVEKKRVEKLLWRADVGEEYYHLGTQGIPMEDKEGGLIADANRYKFGNYFHTIEQAEEAAKRMKETLRKYHEEIKE